MDEAGGRDGIRCGVSGVHGLKPSPTALKSQAFPIRSQPQTIRGRSRRAGPANEHASLVGLDALHQDGTGVPSRRKAEAGERTLL